jgi:hypothetical protein
VVLGSERVPREADRADLRLRRKLAAAEPVHPHHSPRSGHFLEDALHFVRIIGKRIDLILRQDGVEAVVVRIGSDRGLVSSDGHVLVELLDLQHRIAPVLTRTDADVRHDQRLESREADLDRIPAWEQIVRGRDALAVRRHVVLRHRGRSLLGPFHLHERARNDAATRVLDDHAQGTGLWTLRFCRCGGDRQDRRHDPC